MPLLVLASEPVASRRRVKFFLVAPDGITPALGEAGGQPQINLDSAGWTNAGIGTLTAAGNGYYYADLTTAALATPGTRIETRYKSATTAECPNTEVMVVAFDPYLDALSACTVEAGVNARQALALIGAEACGQLAADASGNYTFSAMAHPGTVRIVAATARTGRTSVTLTPPS